jgi:DNA anti-recombination protein RmuC
MKEKLRQIGVIGILILFLSVAAWAKDETTAAAVTNSPGASLDKVKEHAKDTVAATKDYLAGQKERWTKTYSDKMSRLDKQMSELKAKAARASDKGRSEWTNTVARLQQKKETAAHKLEQLKEAGADKWQEFKTGAEKAFAEADKALKEAFSRFKHEEKPAKR